VYGAAPLTPTANPNVKDHYFELILVGAATVGAVAGYALSGRKVGGAVAGAVVTPIAVVIATVWGLA
jgi:hypothetical protein